MKTTPLTALIRLATFAALASVCLAVVLGYRHAPASTDRGVADAPVLPAVALTYVATAADHVARFLDVQTGDLVRVDFDDEELIDQASCSPGRDVSGRRLMVGRWSSLQGRGVDSLSQDFGLALVALPEGRYLHKVRTEVWPVAPPCWYPGAATRVLFAAGNGRLYHFDFASQDDASGLLSRTPEPAEWAVPGVEAPSLLTDPCWIPAGPAGDLLLATVSPSRGKGRRAGVGEVWWLKLDDGGTRIVAAGRLTTPIDDRDGDPHEESRPTLSTTPEGETVLLYQTRRPESRSWQLRMATVTVAETSPPRATASTVLDQDDRIGNFALSQDGRWVYAIHRNWAADPDIRRVPLESFWLARQDSAAETIH